MQYSSDTGTVAFSKSNGINHERGTTPSPRLLQNLNLEKAHDEEEEEDAETSQRQPLLITSTQSNFHRRSSPRSEDPPLIIDETIIPFRKIPSDENLFSNYSYRYSVFGFTSPLTIEWFYSVIGAEYCHIYFWLLKDLAWMQSWLFLSIFYGSLALVWSFLILYHSLRTFNWHELWNFIALFMWLFANFWWMIGEAHDYEFPDAIPISIHHTDTSSVILTAALIWELFYYFIILPCNLLQCSKQALAEYDDGIFQPRFPCFRNFRQYENLHMLFWITKDLAWNRLQFVLWIISVIPTILIAADFIYISAKYTKHDSTLDITHYTAVLIWVVGNSVWAYGDFFVDDTTTADPVLATLNAIFRSSRFYSSWILFVGIVLLFLMYGVWGTLTLSGRLGQFNREDSTIFTSDSKEEESLLGNGNVISSYTNSQLTGRNASASLSQSNSNGSITGAVLVATTTSVASDGVELTNRFDQIDNPPSIFMNSSPSVQQKIREKVLSVSDLMYRDDNP